MKDKILGARCTFFEKYEVERHAIIPHVLKVFMLKYRNASLLNFSKKIFFCSDFSIHLFYGPGGIWICIREKYFEIANFGS